MAHGLKALLSQTPDRAISAVEWDIWPATVLSSQQRGPFPPTIVLIPWQLSKPQVIRVKAAASQVTRWLSPSGAGPRSPCEEASTGHVGVCSKEKACSRPHFPRLQVPRHGADLPASRTSHGAKQMSQKSPANGGSSRGATSQKEGQIHYPNSPNDLVPSKNPYSICPPSSPSFTHTKGNKGGINGCCPSAAYLSTRAALFKFGAWHHRPTISSNPSFP